MHQHIASLIIHQTIHKQEYRCVILIFFALETFLSETLLKMVISVDLVTEFNEEDWQFTQKFFHTAQKIIYMI